MKNPPTKPNKKGFLVGEWPLPRPHGLDLFLLRATIGVSQRAMAFELQVNRNRLIEWERGGRDMPIPARNVAWRIAMLMVMHMPEPKRKKGAIADTFIRANG